MQSELIYVGDTYCLWCYAFSESLNRIATEYSDRLRVRVVHGGMIPENRTLRAFFGRFPDPTGLHEQVSAASGAIFGEPYLYQIRNFKASKRIFNSLNPASAIEVLKSLGANDVLAIYSKIYEAHYVHGLDLNDFASYIDVAKAVGVEFNDFKERFRNPASQEPVIDDLLWVHKMGISGFPALLLKRSDNHYKMVARGFMPYPALKQEVEAAIGEQAVVSMAERACDIGGGSGC